MNAQDLTLNIAVNMGRLARWVYEGKTARLAQFMKQTDDYLQQLEAIQKSRKFEKTFMSFKKKFEKLKESKEYDKIWAEDALTWANILTHRAKLASP